MMAEMDIFKFTKDVLGIELLPYQEEALRRMAKGETVVIVPARTATTLELAEGESRLRKIWDEYRRRFKKQDAWDELWKGVNLDSEAHGHTIRSVDWHRQVKAAGDEIKRKADIWQQIKTARDKLYEDLPTGDVDAFALIKVVQTHIAKLDEILEDS